MALGKLQTLAPLLGAVLAALLSSACSSQLPAISSGQIGCAEQDIVISDEGGSWSTTTWAARCRGKTFYCTSVAGSGDTAGQINCKEAAGSAGKGKPTRDADAADEVEDANPAPPATPTSAEGGCKYDTQCKGDRVCEKGTCVTPTGPAAPVGPATPLSPVPTAP